MTHHNQSKPTGAGSSSFNLIDVDHFFKELNLQKGIVFLDVACGSGAYSMKASQFIGPTGTLYAIDLWEEGIEQLKKRAAETGLLNLKAFVGDVGRRVPVADQVVDVCLMATVLHDFVEDRIAQKVLPEIVRVLKTDGVLAVVEFKIIDGPPGPPIHVRLSPEQVGELLSPYGFKKKRYAEIGDYNYLVQFSES
jgi:ubiquinone/menaquinone biosynthesis C-methylase UbiE